MNYGHKPQWVKDCMSAENHVSAVKELESNLQAAMLREEVLREALNTYARHLEDCTALIDEDDSKCSCELYKAII